MELTEEDNTAIIKLEMFSGAVENVLIQTGDVSSTYLFFDENWIEPCEGLGTHHAVEWLSKRSTVQPKKSEIISTLSDMVTSNAASYDVHYVFAASLGIYELCKNINSSKEFDDKAAELSASLDSGIKDQQECLVMYMQSRKKTYVNIAKIHRKFKEGKRTKARILRRNKFIYPVILNFSAFIGFPASAMDF